MTVALYLNKWRLTPDGDPIRTHSSTLLPVRQGETPAMLKIAVSEEERRGAAVMAYYDGDGAARVLARGNEAILLERASSGLTLAGMARNGRDDDATAILCAAVARLHAPRRGPAPAGLVPLREWFRSLERAAQNGGPLAAAFGVAQTLLNEQETQAVLHGDIHHGNVLFDRARGWLAIDPKGLIGDRAFDYANIFCNPDAAVAAAPGRLQRQAVIVSAAAQIERHRLLGWILAYAGLSASWFIEDGQKPDLPLTVAHIARAELGVS